MQAPRTGLFLRACMLLATLCTATDTFAIDYFVRKTGSDTNAGTSPASAWLTIDHAADSVAPGDTIYVGAGTYTELVLPAVGGTPTLPIRIIADTDGTQTGDAGEVVIAAPSSSSMALYIVNVSYIHIDGFKITGGLSRTIYWNNSDGGVLDNCEITGSSYYGLYVYRSGVNVRNCNIHSHGNNGIYAPSSSANKTLVEVTDSIINNNRNGVYASQQYVTINLNRCKIQDNAAYGIYVTGAKVTATNCLITGTTGASGVYGRSSCDVTLQNCTIADNNQSGVYAVSGGAIVASNCLIANNKNYGLCESGGTLTHTYNLLYGNVWSDFAGTSQDATEIVADPQFLGGGYQIPSTSPAVNAGNDMTGIVDDDITGKSRPYDGAWDIGCYEEGPVVHWKLDEITGKVAVDSSGFGNDGTYEDEPPLGQSCAPYGTAVYFQKYMPSIYLPGNSTINDIESFTAAVWAKSDTATWNDDNYLLSKEDGKFSLYGSGGGKLINVQIKTALGNSYDSFDLSTIANFDLRNWHHYAASYDATEGVIRLYVDGALVKSKSITSSPLASGSMNLMVNEQYVVMSVIIDDVRLYDRRLSDQEIALLYGLVLHLPLDEQLSSYPPNGTPTPDTSGLGNDGAYYGACLPGDFVPYPGETGVMFDDPAAIRVPHSKSLVMSNTGAFTLACWMQVPAGNPLGSFDILGKHDENGRSAYLMRLEANERIGVYLNEGKINGGSGVWVDYSDISLNWNQVYHVAITYDGAMVKWYFDGVLHKTALVSVAIGDEGHDVVVGDLGAIAGYVEGVDDVRIYNRALCPSEINEIAGGGTVPGVRIIKWVEVR